MEFFDFEAVSQSMEQYGINGTNDLDEFDFSFLADSEPNYMCLESPDLVHGHNGPSVVTANTQSGGFNRGLPAMMQHTLNEHAGAAITTNSDLSQLRSLLPQPSIGNATKSTELSGKPIGSTKFTKDAVHILKTWFRDHFADPYPNDAEKEMLGVKTGLRKEQISTWLANARRYSKKRQQRAAELPERRLSETKSTNPIDIIPPSGVSYKDLNPMDRWKASPPEFDPAPISAISNAAASFKCGPTPPREGGFPGRADSDTNSNPAYPTPALDSMGSFQVAHSNASSSSIGSASSIHSFSSGASRTSSKGNRRRRGWKSTHALKKKTGEKRPFECTFCTDTFKTKYDWQRHEKSLHLSLERWQCAPIGPVDLLTGTCVFCGQSSPDSEHLQIHNYLACAEKSHGERIFYRKDNLRQHLKLFHEGCTYLASTMDCWVSPMPDISSRCGFCNIRLPTWTERADHIGAHFKTGLTMDNWIGDHGFPLSIARLCQNFIPPYFIGQERRTPDPFSASNSAHIGWPLPSTQPSTTYGFTATQTCALHLESQLAIFVKGELSRGHVPTDAEIQLHARMVIFDDPDPWNHTWAEYPEWLKGFKRRVGVVHVPGLGNKNVFVGCEDGPTDDAESCLVRNRIKVGDTSVQL